MPRTKDTRVPEIADRWVAALRSGDYDQGIHLIRDNENKFCCLGVVCDVLITEEFIEGWHWDEPDDGHRFYPDNPTAEIEDIADEWNSFVPYPLIDIIGLRDRSGLLNEIIVYNPEDLTQWKFWHDDSLTDDERSAWDDAQSLAELNDAGWTFAMIADLIEQFPERVFYGEMQDLTV